MTYGLISYQVYTTEMYFVTQLNYMKRFLVVFFNHSEIVQADDVFDALATYYVKDCFEDIMLIVEIDSMVYQKMARYFESEV